jgi:hypothetical protein
MTMTEVCGVMRSRGRARLILLGGALLLAAGCGMADYERHIDFQQKRLEFLDLEARTLNPEWITNPVFTYERDGKTETGRFWPYEVFLRLPTKFTNTETYTTSKGKVSYRANPGSDRPAQDVWLFHYPGENNTHFLIAAGWVLDKDRVKDNKKVPDWTWTPEKFREDVRLALMDYYRKELKVQPEIPVFQKYGRKQVQAEVDRGERPPAVGFDWLAFRDNRTNPPMMFHVFFYQQPDKQVAIVVQLPLDKENDENLKRMIDWSLASFDVSPTAISAKRAALAARK